MLGIDRQRLLRKIKEETKSLEQEISRHLDVEEQDLFPIWQEYFSPHEQGPLLVKTILLSITANWPRSFGYLDTADLTSLFAEVALYATDEELSQISSRAAPFISDETWQAVCAAVPKLEQCERPSQNPLNEVAHIRLAMRNELLDLLPHCQNLNITCKSQLQSFSSRFSFVERIYSFLSDGEHKIIRSELQSRLAKAPPSSSSFSLEAYLSTREEIMDLVSKLNIHILSLADNAPSPEDAVIETSSLAEDFGELSNLMVAHLDDAENHLHPLISKHFGVKEQEAMIVRFMSLMPEYIMHELVLWMFGLVSITDLESMLRSLGRRISVTEFHRMALKLVSCVQKGTIAARDWAELCGRVMELRPYAKATDDLMTREKHGPVSEILRVHKAIRVDMNVLVNRTKALPVDGLPNPRTLTSIAGHVTFLRRMVYDHSKAEDDILLPRLEERKPGCASQFRGEHGNERLLFSVVARCLRDLECVVDANESTKLVWRLRVAARTLRDEMISHLSKEEAHLWPLVVTLFTREEQSHILALIFGNMPSDRLRELLPWMIRVLSVAETNEMMNHILEVTSSTMFEKWLKTWLSWEDDTCPEQKLDRGQASSSSGAQKASGSGANGKPRPRGAKGKSGRKSKSDYVKQVLQHGRDSIQKMIKEIARDEAIDMETRTRLMQDVMLAPFTERQEKRESAKSQSLNQDDDLEPTYAREGVLGCKHYQRAAKLRAACCGRLYSCRICHNDVEETHVMDRYATKEILCMVCSTLQPASGKCINKDCQKTFAKYFCGVCVLYDDDESHTLYHCHSCNVCRVGEGLGVDFFHCMKCNQCMGMKYQKTGHVCVENAMESDCPVCYEYLFTSTSPVKYLQCGHLMHKECFTKFSQKRICCPVCSKSLAEMAPVYKRIDNMLAKQNLPPAYRNMLCDVFCNDCNKRSKSPFHFLYQKCQLCESYNTRIDGIVRPERGLSP